MVSSPFNDALEVLKEIRDYCERREASLRGWSKHSEAFDLTRVREKADKAIQSLCPGTPEEKSS